jgi:hypothetical protein
MMVMDLNGLLRLIFLEKSDLTVGVLIGLTLLVVVLMLVRSVMEEKQAPVSGGVGVDQKTLSLAVEGALKKALAENPIAKSLDANGVGNGALGDVSELSKTLSAREAKIATLVSELDALKVQAESKSATGAGGADNSAELLALQDRVKDLQAKLSEYEIIEDDIADLSIFKEENKKLKDEIEKLRAAAQTAQVQVQTAQESVATPTPSANSVQAVQAAIVEPSTPASPAPAPVEAFSLDTDDAVMGEFAQALSAGAATEQKPQSSMNAVEPEVATESPSAPELEEVVADPFGPLDTEKIIAEVSSLGDGAEDVSTSVLEDELDTDRLMAEMGMGETVAESATAEVAAEPEVLAASPKPEVKPTIVEADPSKDIPVDDLLAEFKDNDYPTLKGTKGS